MASTRHYGRVRQTPVRASTSSRALTELTAWIKPVIIIGLIVWGGRMMSLPGGPPDFKEECSRYINQYHPPVEVDQVVAFLRGEDGEEERSKALFLTRSSIVYFDGNTADSQSPSKSRELNLFSPHEVDIAISNIKHVTTYRQGYFGIKFVIHGSQGESIEFLIPNRKYADFFLEKLKSVGGPVQL